MEYIRCNLVRMRCWVTACSILSYNKSNIIESNRCRNGRIAHLYPSQSVISFCVDQNRPTPACLSTDQIQHTSVRRPSYQLRRQQTSMNSDSARYSRDGGGVLGRRCLELIYDSRTHTTTAHCRQKASTPTCSTNGIKASRRRISATTSGASKRLP